MLTLLLYVLIVGLVAALLFLVASAVFGRGEELGPLPEGTTATVLPAVRIHGGDVRALRFQQVFRGYKAGEVDWALTRLAARIDELEHQLAEARGEQPPTPTSNGTPPAEQQAHPDRTPGPRGFASGASAPPNGHADVPQPSQPPPETGPWGAPPAHPDTGAWGTPPSHHPGPEATGSGNTPPDAPPSPITWAPGQAPPESAFPAVAPGSFGQPTGQSTAWIPSHPAGTGGIPAVAAGSPTGGFGPGTAQPTPAAAWTPDPGTAQTSSPGTWTPDPSTAQTNPSGTWTPDTGAAQPTISEASTPGPDTAQTTGPGGWAPGPTPVDGGGSTPPAAPAASTSYLDLSTGTEPPGGGAQYPAQPGGDQAAGRRERQ
ncbi:DivIVA domain-containing protein [Nocardia transvalensis]|uniref:DivIVA domain-containing protein n=1 Tax=Nocardia transvalensis TaxID=37333 RepID=A0A7W9PAN8_9NOCA|nr:DivIVA domain-containing protein [Nocardia transvalensis]